MPEQRRNELEQAYLAELGRLSSQLGGAVLDARWADVEQQMLALDRVSTQINDSVMSDGFASSAVAEGLQHVQAQCLDALQQVRDHRSALDERADGLRDQRAGILTQWPGSDE